MSNVNRNKSDMAPRSKPVVFTVLGTPAPQGSKRHVGHGIMIESSKALKPWREAMKLAARDEWLRMGQPTFDGPVRLFVEFYFKRPQAHFGTGSKSCVLKSWAPLAVKVKPDVDKLCRGLGDALTDAGVVSDDSRIVQLDASKIYVGGGRGALDVPGALVVVTPLDDGGSQPPLGYATAHVDMGPKLGPQTGTHKETA